VAVTSRAVVPARFALGLVAVSAPACACRAHHLIRARGAARVIASATVNTPVTPGLFDSWAPLWSVQPRHLRFSAQRDDGRGSCMVLGGVIGAILIGLVTQAPRFAHCLRRLRDHRAFVLTLVRRRAHDT
jgi:hypothetical protein